jgi:mxaJ protein
VENVIGFSVYGDYTKPNPPARIVDAVANGEIDVGIVWGPLAGYFASQSEVPLRIEPVHPQIDPPSLPMAFDVAIGVRKKDKVLRDQLNEILIRRQAEVNKILDEYHIPHVQPPMSRARYDETDDDHDSEVPGCCE